MGWYGPWPTTEQLEGAPKPRVVPKFKSPKSATHVRYNKVYCIKYPDGKYSMVSEKQWNKVRAQAAKQKWHETVPQSKDGINNKPRFYLGYVEWEQWFDDTEDDPR